MHSHRDTPELPIYSHLEELRAALRVSNTVILEAPPGSGKSTVVPWKLMEETWLGSKKIVMLEPRRLATRAVADRMAWHLGERTGETVGYRIRFDAKVSARTRIEVVTEGILTRMLQRDNALDNVGLVIFDEFHERNLHADLALALVREAQQVLREDLRVLVMSATLDVEKLSTLLGGAPIVRAQGRQYPVEISYHPVDDRERIERNVSGLIHRALREEKGDILAFLPGAGEIERTATLLRESEPHDVSIYPLYGDLSHADQERAITPDPSGKRKVVLATSIAETSLTIEGIGVVVDSGLARVQRFDPRSGFSKLVTAKVTRDAADQRAGRAGRLGPGVAYRMWAEAAHHQLLAHRSPEILEADLAPLMLELVNWGVNDPESLTWLTPPTAGSVAAARELLEQLGALEDSRITEQGRAMLRFPAHPRLAHMLITAEEDHELSLACDVAALIEERDPLPREASADLSLRVEAVRRHRSGSRGNWERNAIERIDRVAMQWHRIADAKPDRSTPQEHEIGKLVASAYPDRIARSTGEHGKYRLSNGRIAKLPEHDPLAGEEWLAIADMDAGNREARIFLAAVLDVSDVVHHATTRNVLAWDQREGVLTARREKRIGEITLETKPITDIPDDERVKVVCDAIRSVGLRMLPTSDAFENFRARVESVHSWRPDDEWPSMTDDELLATLEIWLGPHLTTVRKQADLDKLDLVTILRNSLEWSKLQELDKLAPTHVTVPTGSEIRLEYFMDGRSPVLAVRLQEMFGLLDTPTVNGGRTKVLLHLLSPGYKPVQVTQDLRSFWQNGYPEVRKELRIRYPKHSWPEDPWTAQAVRGAVRRRQ